MSSERSIRSRHDDATELSHDAFHARINRFCKGLDLGRIGCCACCQTPEHGI
jgi:hypothetical protein